MKKVNMAYATQETKRERRNWTKEWSVHLCRELCLTCPYEHEPGSKNSVTAWNEVTKNMWKIEGFLFDVKAIRDHYNGLQRKRRAVVNNEKKLSGVVVELTELQVLLDEIYDDVQKEKELMAGKT